MSFLSEPFSLHPLIWASIIMIILTSSLIGYMILITIYPDMYPKTNHYKVIDSLNCNELKDWIKYTQSSIAENMYVNKCLK